MGFEDAHPFRKDKAAERVSSGWVQEAPLLDYDFGFRKKNVGPKARVGLDAFGMGGVGCALGGQGRGPPAARKEKEKKKECEFSQLGARS